MLRVIGARRSSVTYVTEQFDGSDTSVYTFTGVDIGAAANDRLVVVGTGIVTLNNPSSVQIDGVETTQLTDTLGVNRNHPELWSLPVSSGTTADIRVTASGAIDCHIAVWSVYGLKSTVAHDTAFGQDSVNLAVPNRGIVIAYARTANGSGNVGPYSWSGVTEDFDRTQADLNGVSGGSIASVPASASYTVSATPDSGIGYLSAASWS